MCKLLISELGLQGSKSLCIPLPLVLLTPAPTFSVSYHSVSPAGLSSKSALVLRTIMILILLASILLSPPPHRWLRRPSDWVHAQPRSACSDSGLSFLICQIEIEQHPWLDRVGQESAPKATVSSEDGTHIIAAHASPWPNNPVYSGASRDSLRLRFCQGV